ncbi:hypothetical protein HHX47_DHR4000004 [Lentinula edodes]|nr:hypothetical protein HHX47_DHR4000004 [Lentinula edodes]
MGTIPYFLVWLRQLLRSLRPSLGKTRAGLLCRGLTHTTEWVKVREGLTEETPTIADLDDCIHLLHNTVGDISKLKAFKEPLDIMKRIVKYFGKSGLATNHLLEYHQTQMTDLSNDKVLWIQKPSGTHFGSLHTSAMLLLPNLPAIQTLIAEKQIKFLKVHS